MPATRLAAWTDSPRAALLDRMLVELADTAKLSMLGGPRVGEVTDLAERHDCPITDDPRQLILAAQDALILLSTDGIERHDVQEARARGVAVAILEPLAGSLEALPTRRRARVAETTGLTPLRMLPRFTDHPGWRSASQPLEVLEPLASLHLDSTGTSQGLSLFARLYDAFDTLLQLLDLPESIDASLVGPLAAPPTRLRGLTGHLGILARYPGRPMVQMRLSDQATPDAESRTLDLLGKGGHLRATDDAYMLHDRDGVLLDRRTAEPRTLAQQLASQWTHSLDPAAALTVTSEDHEARVLACCEAALLSTRTSHPEPPALLLRTAAPA